MKRQELKYQNRVDIDLLTHEKQESPLELDDDTLNISATVLANMLLDFVKANGSCNNLTLNNVFRKENKE